MPMNIRRMQPEDLPELRQIFYTIRSEEFPWEKSEALALSDFDHAVDGEAVYVAVSDGTVQGFVSVWEADAFVHNLFVARPYRSLGVGSALLDHAAEAYPQRALTLKCVVENKHAFRFYLRSGWHIIEENDDDIPYYLMEKSL